jgi:hypothetical protein
MLHFALPWILLPFFLFGCDGHLALVLAFGRKQFYKAVPSTPNPLIWCMVDDAPLAARVELRPLFIWPRCGSVATTHIGDGDAVIDENDTSLPLPHTTRLVGTERLPRTRLLATHSSLQQPNERMNDMPCGPFDDTVHGTSTIAFVLVSSPILL